MTKTKRKIQPSADLPLARTLTDSLIQDFESLLSSLSSSFEVDYLKANWLSKYVDPSSNAGKELRRSRAIEKWLLTELTNDETNARLSDRTLDRGIIYGSVTVAKFFDVLTGVVRSVVGDVPPITISDCGFSGGASTSKRRVDGHPAIKFRDAADATVGGWIALEKLLPEDSLHYQHMISMENRVVNGNVLFTVPKTSEIDRVACKEPDINLFVQKGLGQIIRKNLSRQGINLNDQSVNANLSRIGSVDGSLATLDLSSASDSVSYALVKRAMPREWFRWLDMTRSPSTQIDGRTHVNAMFSSMGNGFTFELESLLFYGICRSVCYLSGVKGRISVYGDDLIVPSPCVEDLIEALTYCGFRVNETKSFWTGQFRESCGAHWYNGYDVTPFYLRKPLARISDLILFLNQLTKWASRLFGVVDPRIDDFHTKWRSIVPENLWGGQDCASRFALVTGDAPRKRLVPVTRDQAHRHVGGYLSWLHATSQRNKVYTLLPGNVLGQLVLSPMDAVESSQNTSVTPICRVRRNMESVNADLPLFLSRYSRVA